jgi:ubiquitin-protein ligase
MQKFTLHKQSIGVLVSIISLLADPNCSSPANVDAGVAYRKNREAFDAIVKSSIYTQYVYN